MKDGSRRWLRARVPMVTLRMVRAAQRETDTYDRNREVLFDLRQSGVRAQIHSLLVRMI